MDGSIYGGVLLRPDAQTSFDEPEGDALTAQLATSADVLRDAWTIRHAAYSSHGFIEPTSTRMFMDECDFYSSSKTVVLYKNQLPIATVRVCLYAPGSDVAGAHTVPAMDVFHDEIIDLLRDTQNEGSTSRAVEVMRLATHPDLGNSSEVAFALFLMAGYIVLQFDANAVLCAVRKHHMPFYRRVGLRKVTEPRAYPKLKFQTGLMACVRNSPQELQQSMPILHPISRHDGIYRDFIAGRPVPVFEPERSPAVVSRLLSNRVEPVAGAVRYPNPTELALAA